MSPKQTRWIVRRKFDQIINNIQTGQSYLTELGLLYKDQHPDIAKNIAITFEYLELCKHTIEQIRDSI